MSADNKIDGLDSLSRVRRFKETTGALSGGANHPDRCVCQDGPDAYPGTPHQHYQDRPPYPCARCSCSEYRPAVMSAAVEAHANDEHILCAAIYVDTGEADPPRRTYSYPKTGIVFCGWRHCDCFVPLTAWAQRLTPVERARVGEEQIAGLHQGFLTSRGRYVDRVEGMVIAKRAGQTDAEKTDLFSEDLY